MKDDERKLLQELQRQSASGDIPYVRCVVSGLGINWRRAAYICDKWAAKGWYDYGVNVLAGWLTEKGKAIEVEIEAGAEVELEATR